MTPKKTLQQRERELQSLMTTPEGKINYGYDSRNRLQSVWTGTDPAHPGVANAYRVLTSEGRVSAGFNWTSEDEEGDVRSRLTADGVAFTISSGVSGMGRP